jgi:hypothetical protein
MGLHAPSASELPHVPYAIGRHDFPSVAMQSELSNERTTVAAALGEAKRHRDYTDAQRPSLTGASVTATAVPAACLLPARGF